jgi:large subunit ribosomal protein L25
MEFIQIQVAERSESGKGAIGRLRRAGHVPGVLYGLARRNLPLSIPGEELERFLKTRSHLVELRMGDQTRAAILREVQLDPISEQVLHVDFVRVDKDLEIEDHVPIVFKGIAKGTAEGGIFQSLTEDLEVRCRPQLIPAEIVIDVSGLGVHDGIHVKDIPLPEGVAHVGEPDDLVCHVVPVREEAAAAEPGAEAAAAEPEIIRKEKEGKEDAEAKPAKEGKASK